MQVASTVTTGMSMRPHVSTVQKQRNFIEIIQDDKTKKWTNYISNGISCFSSLFTFLNGNFNFIDSLQEKFEKVSEGLSKAAFSIAHIIGAIDLWQKKNFFPFSGYAIATPIALLSSGYNMWLAVGAAEALINLAVVIDKREITDKNGNPILDKNKKIQFINGDFRNRGWKESITTTLHESKNIVKELYKDPTKIKKFSHSLLFNSLAMLVAPLFGFFGFKKVESFIRNTATVGVESTMLFHGNEEKTKKEIKLTSPFPQSALLWISASISDFLKRFNFISDRVKNLTHLSLFFDRFASTRFTQGILNIKAEPHKG